MAKQKLHSKRPNDMQSLPGGGFSSYRTVGSRIGLPAGFVFAAGAGTVGAVNQNVIVAGGADQSVNRFAELVVPGRGRVLAARLLAAHSHLNESFRVTVSTQVIA
jgi:hypothetical protein